MPIWVEGGEWNQTRGVWGSTGVTASGDEGRASLRVLCTRAATVSDSSDSPSEEEAEPDIESSRPVTVVNSRTARHESVTMRHTVDELSKLCFWYWFSAVQANLDIVSMPIGAVVSALIFNIDKTNPKADGTRARADSGLSGRSGRLCARRRRRGRIGDLVDNVAGNESL